MLCFPKEGLRGICPFFFFHKYAYICKWIRRNLKETVLVKNKRSPPSCHGGGGGGVVAHPYFLESKLR